MAAETAHPPQIYVFGCFSDAGHYLLTVTKQYAAEVPHDVHRACDAFDPSIRAEHQREGDSVPIPAMPPGWSYTSWWDRQGDRRHGSLTGILAAGEWTREQLLDAGRTLAPWAYRVEVTRG